TRPSQESSTRPSQESSTRPSQESSTRRRQRSVSQTFLGDLLTEQLADWQQETGTDPITIVDLGGGTGGLATSLAGQGHAVTVIDPSPDALASLERRAAESQLSDRVTALQGDAGDLVELVGTESVDVLICHRVLEYVDQPADALREMAACLRPAGLLSLLVAGRRSAALTHALNGQFRSAREVLDDERRFDPDRLKRLLGQSGFEIVAQHGIGAIADLVPESAPARSQQSREDLFALEHEISTDPVFRALAPYLHIAARLS
ncbi:MAG: methyltransferase domain-containing protein, partial [Propionibacteriales bacterium]|nr:methyltransferase domain-containing protein [Propionibacteriales bacterium]